MSEILIYATFGCLAVSVALWVVNIIRAVKDLKQIKWLGRLVYIFGMLAVIFNGIRMILDVEGYKGTYLVANVVVLICILIAFIKNERS